MDPIAAARVPWIGLLPWDVIDLQIDIRTGAVSGSILSGGILRLRKGDSFRLAVIFYDGSGTVVNPAPTRLRWSIRDAANLELVAATPINAPTAQTDQPAPYFLITPDVSRLGASALDLLPDGSNSLSCVADLDWEDALGATRSSRSFPVSVEFGLTPQFALATTTPTPTSPTAATTPSPVTTPPVATTPPVDVPAPRLDEAEIRALFDQWLMEKLPVEAGFLYVQNGEFEAAVPGENCVTGQPWTP